MSVTDHELEARSHFGDRLRATLRANKISLRPAVFARGFNLRANTLSVTPHAARKWLVGEAIPAQERIVILAKWLNVNAAWLRFGDGDSTPKRGEHPIDVSLSESEAELVRGIMALSQPSQVVVQKLVESLKVLEEAIGSQKSRSRGDGA